jgi:hypothetical protein
LVVEVVVAIVEARTKEPRLEGVVEELLLLEVVLLLLEDKIGFEGERGVEGEEVGERTLMGAEEEELELEVLIFDGIGGLDFVVFAMRSSMTLHTVAINRSDSCKLSSFL